MGCGASSSSASDLEEKEKRINKLEKEVAAISAEKDKLTKKVGQLERRASVKNEEVALPVLQVEKKDDQGDQFVTIQLVLSRSAIDTVRKTAPTIEITEVNASADYSEVPVNLSGTVHQLQKILTLCDRGIAEVPILPGPEEEEPDPSDAKPTTEEEQNAAQEAEATETPNQEFKCKSNIAVSPTWSGAVTLSFEWVDWASPYSEYLNPSGSNWRGSVLQAPSKTPQDIKLQWRQGVGSDWQTIDAPGGKAQLELKPEEVSTLAFNGFQSRWSVDGELYLSPLQKAPTLIGKLMNYPMIRNAWYALPPEKRNVSNLPESLQKPINTLEDLIPMNTWDVGYGVMQVPGVFVGEEHVMSTLEKAANIAKEKMMDPKIQATLRGEALKAPVNIMSAALGTVGVKLDAVVKNLDFFIPKMSEPDFEMMPSDTKFERNRRDIEIDVNTLYPQYQQGLRVCCPTATDVKNVLKTKRPSILAGSTIPLDFEHTFTEEQQYAEEGEVSVTVWPLDSPGDRTTLKLECTPTEEKDGLLSSNMKVLYKNYKITHALPPGGYGYTWTVKGKVCFDEGRSVIPDKDCFSKLHVVYGVKFGVGVKMP